MGSQLHAFYAALEEHASHPHSPEHPAAELEHAAVKNSSVVAFSNVEIKDTSTTLHDDHAIGTRILMHRQDPGSD